ncbi:MAG TPA: alanine racemase [Bacillota bacterium]|nr:alanine racemase [Bacillota bacterium]
MKGRHISHLDTPSLLLDKRVMKQNLQNIVQFAEANHVAYRPHIKTHKSIDIAKMQLESGAVGITVATVGEAEVMVSGGVENILIAFPIFTAEKLERIYQLLDRAEIILTIDSEEQVDVVNEFFRQKDERVYVWLKVNSGLNRCGVEVEDVKALVERMTDKNYVELTGIYTHAGHSYAASSTEALEEIAEKEAEVVLASAHICESLGVQVAHKSIGSTPTFKIAGQVDGITEIRPGNAIFYDMVQVGLGVATIEDCAVTVASRVASIKRNRIVIDAGSKTLSLDKGAHGNESIAGHGYIKEYPELIISRLSEEHGVIDCNPEDYPQLEIGDVLTIVPNHACTVVNLFDQYVVHEDGSIIEAWDVSARGRLK